MPTEEEVIVDISPRTVNRKFCRNLTWNKLANDADIYTAAVQLQFYNLVLSLAISLGLFLQFSTLKYSYKTLPTYYGLNQDTNIVGHGSLAGGWMCVCSEGTSFIKPFPDYATGKDNYTFYEPNQFVLGHGTWLEGWQSIRLTTFLR